MITAETADGIFIKVDELVNMINTQEKGDTYLLPTRQPNDIHFIPY